MDVRHFLVTRNREQLSSVEIYHDPDVAHDAYCAKERWCALHAGFECVLLGAEPLDLGFGLAVAKTLPPYEED